MRSPSVLTNCAQPVHGLGFGQSTNSALSAAGGSALLSLVGKNPTYTWVKPTFVLGLVHAFLLFLVSVTSRFVHIIHRTNKDHDKLKVIINS